MKLQPIPLLGAALMNPTLTSSFQSSSSSIRLNQKARLQPCCLPCIHGQRAVREALRRLSEMVLRSSDWLSAAGTAYTLVVRPCVP